MSLFAQNQGPTAAPIIYGGLNVGSSQWNLPVPIMWGMRRLSTNAIWFNNFRSQPADGKGKGGGGKAQSAKTYTADVALALCEGVVDDISHIWGNGSTTTTTTLSALNMVFFNGTLDQAPWGHVVTYYPAQARAYSQLAYLGAPGLALGESATIPDNAFECIRTNGFAYVQTSATSGWIDPNSHAQGPGVDCLMSDIVTDFLTNVQYGMNGGSGDIDASIDQLATYHRAQGLFFSPLINSQEKATDIIDRWAQLSNTWIFWDGTKYRFVPLGDSVITGNGVTYTPVDDVAYNLGPNDFLKPDGSSGGVVTVTRIDPADAKNRTALNFTDRTLGYINNPVEWKDDGLVSRYGLRDDSSVQADEICDPAVAKIAVQLIGKRNAYIRNTYAFKTSHRYILCLPGTILTLTDPTIPISMIRVRVKTVSRGGKDKNGNGTLSFVCEEFPGNVGTYYPPVASAAVNTATTPVTNLPPGNVNTPAIIEPASTFTGGVPKILIAASGGANWGGCYVLISFNGVDYSQIGQIQAPAKQGLLTANLAAFTGANPDTTDTLSVDCTQSLTTPTPVTDADATALRTLSLVAAQPILTGGAYVMPGNGELLAFGNVAATATYAADLTYLVRGAYGTAPGAHSTGDQFTQIDVSGTDATSVAYELPAQYIGQTVYLKFLSYNAFEQALQDETAVAEYQYTPTGAGYGTGTGGTPAEPSGLSLVGTPGSNAVALAWAANGAADNVTGYTLWRATGTGASFGSAAAVWSGAALAYTDTTIAAASGYTYFLTADNAVGQSPPTAGVNATTASSSGSGTSVVTVSSSPYQLGTPPALTWYVDIDNTSGAPLAIKLPTATPLLGQRIIITDAGGNAGTNAFTVENGTTPIDTVTVDNGWSTVRWNGAAWLRSA